MSNNMSNKQIDIDHPLDEQSNQIIKCFTEIIDALITLNNKYEYSSSIDYKEDYNDFIKKSNNFIKCYDIQNQTKTIQTKTIQTIAQKIDSITSNVTHQYNINRGEIKPVYGETFKVKNFKDDIIRLHKLFILLLYVVVDNTIIMKKMLDEYGTKYNENELYGEVALKMGFKSKRSSTKRSKKQKSKKQRSKKRLTKRSTKRSKKHFKK